MIANFITFATVHPTKTQPIKNWKISTQPDPTQPMGQPQSCSTRSFVTRVNVTSWLAAAKLGRLVLRPDFTCDFNSMRLEGKYSRESTDPRESEIRAPPEPLPYLMPIPPTRFLNNK